MHNGVQHYKNLHMHHPLPSCCVSTVLFKRQITELSRHIYSWQSTRAFTNEKLWLKTYHQLYCKSCAVGLLLRMLLKNIDIR